MDLFRFADFKHQKLETLTRCLIIIVAIAAMILAWPINLLHGQQDGNGRLRFDPSLHYASLGTADYGISIIHGQDHKVVDSITIGYRVTADAEGNGIDLHYDLFSTTEGQVTSGDVEIPGSPASGMCTIPVQFTMASDTDYEFIYYVSDADRISFIVEEDGEIALVPHFTDNATKEALQWLDVTIRLLIWVIGIMAIAFALRGKQDAPGMIVLAASVFMFIIVTQYILDHNAESLEGIYVGIGMTVFFTILIAAELYLSDFKWLRPAILLAIGVIYLIVLKPGVPPDEQAHFFRSFEIACGNLFSKVYEGGQGGNVFPVALRQITNTGATLDWSNTEIFTFSNTALYFPTCYLPQAIGVWIAKLFTNHVMTIFYAGRIVNFLFAYFVSIAALRRMPFGKSLLFVFMLFPMTLQEMVSMSPDALTNAVSAYLIALVMSIRMEDREITRSELIRILAIGLFLGASKVVYIVVTFLVLLLPTRILGGKKKAIRFYSLIIGSSIIMNLLTYSNSLQFLGDLTADVSAKGQVLYVLGHPVETLFTMIRTFSQDLHIWTEDMLGTELGSLNIDTNRGLAYAMVALITTVTFDAMAPQEYFRHREIIACFATGVLGFCATIGSLYVSWTKVGAPKIVGIQGRYFIPFTLIILLAIAMIHSRQVSHVTQERMNVQQDYSEKGLRYRLVDMAMVLIAMIAACDVYLYYIKLALRG